MDTSHSYFVGGDNLTVDWNWDGNPDCWMMSCKEGSKWHRTGPLSDQGRRMLLQHFELEERRGSLQLEAIQYMSPMALVAVRRQLERGNNHQKCSATSASGDHISAEFCT